LAARLIAIRRRESAQAATARLACCSVSAPETMIAINASAVSHHPYRYEMDDTFTDLLFCIA
jgi:hypothetical protein